MIEKYLQTFDKNMQRVGILVDAIDVQRRRRLNSDYELAFLLPMTSDDFLEKVQLKGHVLDERGQYYVINSRQRVRDGRKLTAAIVATHVMFKLTDFKMPYPSYISEAYGVHISRLTDAITAATGGRFRFSIDDTFDLCDVKDWGRGHALQALHHILRMYKCEVEPDNFTIHLRKKIGADNGLQYRIRKNIVGSTFRDDVASLVTRMFAQMKDGRTFIGLDASHLTEEERNLLSQVPGAIVNGKIAVNYLISPDYATWASDTVPYFDGEIIEQDVEDPLKLLEATRKALQRREAPLLELTVNAADLFKLDKTEPKPGLGDTVRCIDPEMGIEKLTARIIELTEYPYAMNRHAQAIVANVMQRDHHDMMADLEHAKQAVANMFSGGRIRTEVFENSTKQAITDINNSKTELIYPPEGGILAQEKTDPLRQVRLTSAGLGISTDGWKTIRSAITADRVVAEQIVGQLGNFVTMEIGSGDDVTKINTNGISAGHADFHRAPFRLDMEGNLVANSLTANRAKIFASDFRDGEIVGSSIDVGNGRFTVDRNGNMYAGSGQFRGDISASEISGSKVYGTDIHGGTITGTKIRTAERGRRIEVDRYGLKTYDDGEANRIQIDTGTNQGAASIAFSDSNGSSVGRIGSYSDSDELSIFGERIMIGSNDTSNPISMLGATSFRGPTTFDSPVTFNGGVEKLKIDQDNVEGLSKRLLAIEDHLQALQYAINNHHHTISIPPHNHGNPQNQSSGGGDYTTSTRQ